MKKKEPKKKSRAKSQTNAHILRDELAPDGDEVEELFLNEVCSAAR